MNMTLLSVIAACVAGAALLTRRIWVRRLVAFALWLLIAILLLFQPTAVVRAVLRQGLPSGAKEDGFLSGVRALNDAIFISHIAVIFLCLLILVVLMVRTGSRSHDGSQ